MNCKSSNFHFTYWKVNGTMALSYCALVVDFVGIQFDVFCCCLFSFRLHLVLYENFSSVRWQKKWMGCESKLPSIGQTQTVAVRHVSDGWSSWVCNTCWFKWKIISKIICWFVWSGWNIPKRVAPGATAATAGRAYGDAYAGRAYGESAGYPAWAMAGAA